MTPDYEAAAELDRQHLDMLARTAADEHAIADIEALSEHARAIHLALRAPPSQPPRLGLAVPPRRHRHPHPGRDCLGLVAHNPR